MGPKKNRPKPGDVYASPLADGRYGVVRVLRVLEKSSLIAVSPWLGIEPPALDEPSLREVLVENRFFYNNNRALSWYEGRPTEGLIHLGNLPPSEAEAVLECNTFSGKWHDQMAKGALLEWRWEHDHDALVAEIEAEKDKPPPRQAPGKRHPMLAAKDFWELIGLIDWSKTGDDDAVLAPLVSALTERPVEDILGFDERLADYLYQLDGEVYAREIGEEGYQGPDEFFSVDWFLYVRCCVVANGRSFYMQAKRDSSQMPKGLEFESLLYVASKAYEAKTGEDWDHVSYRSYETFSNRAGWAADDA